MQRVMFHPYNRERQPSVVSEALGFRGFLLTDCPSFPAEPEIPIRDRRLWLKKKKKDQGSNTLVIVLSVLLAILVVGFAGLGGGALDAPEAPAA